MLCGLTAPFHRTILQLVRLRVCTAPTIIIIIIKPSLICVYIYTQLPIIPYYPCEVLIPLRRSVVFEPPLARFPVLRRFTGEMRAKLLPPILAYLYVAYDYIAGSRRRSPATPWNLEGGSSFLSVASLSFLFSRDPDD